MIEGLDLLAIISLTAVVMIGMPHGAMDGAVASTTGHAKTPWQMLRFVALYLILTALVVIVWMTIPIFTLTLFLLISLIHFGLGDHNSPSNFGKYIQVICHGGLVVGVIPAVHFAAVEPIFLTLTGAVHPSQLSALWGLLIILNGIIALASLAYAWLAFKTPLIRGRFFEFLALLAVLIALPPLTGFALYFCLIHTPRHVIGVVKAVKRHDHKTPILPLTALFTMATWLMGGITITLMPSGYQLDDAILRVVFIGLAALTVPHMMLVDGVFRPRHLDPNLAKGQNHG